MRMYDIIHKKREGGQLSAQELHFFIQGCTQGEIPDYQTSALLMAIFFQGMSREETANLTLEMARSGDQVDLSPLSLIHISLREKWMETGCFGGGLSGDGAGLGRMYAALAHKRLCRLRRVRLFPGAAGQFL